MGLFKSIKKRINKKKDRKFRKKVIRKGIDNVFSDLVVKHGPFQGMIYPDKKSVGSSFFPKILGSYELELHDVLNLICDSDYSCIVDIGCAEGYYAVGLAMRLKKTRIYAYDIEPEAINLCRKMCEINKLDMDRFVFGNLCTSEILLSIPLGEKALIVCDCEGCEKNLFSRSLVKSLYNHDFLIETHDCIDIDISTQLYDIFKETHNIKIIQSIDDILKAKYYEFKELEDYSLLEKKILLSENRKSIMEWFFAVPKKRV
ncbi:MAG: hypothetical protein CSA18_04460 [Deltaproteobacteria bacterium]|nr:MAG: hypothetical protein CSA18_04460 [Deltaproteobacteria bacterium]